MRAFLLVVALASAKCFAQEYVPGEAGAEWSADEVDIMRQRVLAMLEDQNGPTEMQLFRLSFHDCVTYTDGTGGCDGCLNWKNIDDGPRRPSPFSRVGKSAETCENQMTQDRFNATDNRGLDGVAESLEELYTTTDVPSSAPALTVSLQGSGKSRADFWQFAVNVALERTIERSNTACRYDNKNRQQVSLLENDGKGLAYGIWKCKIKLQKPFKFQTGRKDCIPDPDLKYPYIANKDENHFNPHANGPELLEDLKAKIGMSAEDFLATAFPIHAMISNNVFESFSVGTKYEYFSSGLYLTNMFFKFLANRPTFTTLRNPVGTPHFELTATGDEDGNPISMWGFRASCQKCMDNSQKWAGGPCHWRPTAHNTPDAPNQDKIRTNCFNGFDEDNNFKNGSGKGCNDAYISPQGVSIGSTGSVTAQGKTSDFSQWTNQFLLNWEVGMVLKFDTDPESFRASNCEGLEVAEDGSGFVDGKCKVNSVCTSPIAKCPRQDYTDETGKPIIDIVEEFADNHDLWAEKFLDGWQRIQQTGCTGLSDGPQNSWMGYYKLKELGLEESDIGDFEDFITSNAPVVFTKEDTDQVTITIKHKNGKTFKELYAEKDAPSPDILWGPSCETFKDCNDPNFG